MKPITIADDQALEELSEIFKLDVNELRTGWGDLPYEISSDPTRMDIVRSMTRRARKKFLDKKGTRINDITVLCATRRLPSK